ncbi:hypothetical protein K8R04_03740 [Candidatus Uhrbacteria bacterium]|nr:hypothetical protein [Candidatus Uhrbacteria bacterium]
MEQTLPLNPFDKVKVIPSKKRNKKATVSTIPHRLDALPEEHELTKRYKPKFLGKGGENLVYEAEGRDAFVIKAQKQALAETMAWNEASGLEPGDDSIAVEELREGKLLEERKRYQSLKEVFGDHVLNQRFYVMQVPVGPAVREELNQSPQLHHVNIPEKAEAGWTIVSIQERAEAMKDNRRLSMGGANLELILGKTGRMKKDPYVRNVYDRVTDAYMSRDSAETSGVTPVEFEFLMEDTRLEALMRKAERDPGLWKALADFQRKAVEFSEKNQDIMDFAGLDNIIFHRDQDGDWTYTIVDGLYPFATKVLQKGAEAFVKHEMGVKLVSKEENVIIQSINYVRIVNGLGKWLGTGEYIDFLPEELQKKKTSASKFIYGGR